MRSIWFLTYSALVIVVAAGCGNRAASTAGSDGLLYQRSLVERCLVKRHVLASSSPGSVMRAYIRRKTLTGGIHIISGPITGMPGPRIDAGNLLFFKSSSAAKQEQASEADIFLFHKGEGDAVRALFPPPPTQKDSASLQRVIGNVVIFWQWRRIYPDDSDRIINACLAASLR